MRPDQIEHEFRAWTSKARSPSVVIDELRKRRAKRAEVYHEQRRHRDDFLALVDDTDDFEDPEEIKAAAQEQHETTMERKFNTSIPRVSAESLRRFAVQHAEAAQRSKEHLNNSTFTTTVRGVAGYSQCGKADAVADEVEHHTVRALEYIRAARHLE